MQRRVQDVSLGEGQDRRGEVREGGGVKFLGRGSERSESAMSSPNGVRDGGPTARRFSTILALRMASRSMTL